jgi:O-antigen ligase
VGSYLVMFAAMSVYLRTRTQINRLLWTLTAVSMLVSIYGIFQHFGADPLRDLGAPESRARLTFGNPIFAASFLLMTVPLTLAVILPYRDRMIAGTHIWIGAGILALQLTAILFTLSRGPWVGFVVGMMVLFAAMAWTMGWRALSRPVGMFLVGAAIALIMNALPVEGGPGGTAALNERLGSLPSALGGGLANRQVIWETAAEVYFTVPWLDTQQNPEIPDLIVPALRPLVGYGPDMFGYAYPLASDSRYTKDLASHGHNFIVHTAIELGLFGVLAYVGLIVALALALFLLLKGAKAGLYPDWFTYLLIALSGALVSRVVEQIFGKAQVSDLMLSWMLAALVGVLALIAPRLRAEPVSDTGPPAAVPQGRRSARRARRQRRQSDIRLSPLLKLAAAAALAVTILLLWWTAVVPNVRSAIVALDARVAADLGEAQEGVDRYIEAIDLAPSSAVPKLALGQLLFTAALQDAPLTIEQRLDLFDAAYAQVQEVLERNPLDHRAWSRSGEFLRERAALAQQVGADAIHENQILVDLMPGFWQARTGLAWSYVRLGNFELALDAIEEAKRLRGLESNGAHLIFFIEAAALERLGRFDEAIAAAQLSM